MLVLQDVAVTYQNVIPALRGVSLEIPDKVVVALLGTNGAGKTTLLRAISGLLPLHRGTLVGGHILLAGERIDRLSPTRIVQLGIAQVLEGRRLFEDLTVDENLYAGAITVRNPTAIRRAYDRVMSLFPVLAERRSSRAGYLSGGEQQMLAIGRALMASPRLLLLDEPSLGLAPFMVQRIRSIIAEINAEGTAVLLVEQNAQMALSVAHYGYVLETGRVVLAAPAARLLQEENIRQFYLGLREGERQLSLGHLRQRRRAGAAERRWQS